MTLSCIYSSHYISTGQCYFRSQMANSSAHRIQMSNLHECFVLVASVHSGDCLRPVWRLQLFLQSADWCHARIWGHFFHIFQYSNEVRKAVFYRKFSGFQILVTNIAKFLILRTEHMCGLEPTLGTSSWLLQIALTASIPCTYLPSVTVKDIQT